MLSRFSLSDKAKLGDFIYKMHPGNPDDIRFCRLQLLHFGVKPQKGWWRNLHFLSMSKINTTGTLQCTALLLYLLSFVKNENQCNYKGQSEPRKILQQTNENSKWKQANSLKGEGGGRGNTRIVICSMMVIELSGKQFSLKLYTWFEITSMTASHNCTTRS